MASAIGVPTRRTSFRVVWWRIARFIERGRTGNLEGKGAIMISRFFAVIRNKRSIFRIRVKAGGSYGKREPDDSNNGSVGVGVTVPRKPPPPVLIGKDAKPIHKGGNQFFRTVVDFTEGGR